MTTAVTSDDQNDNASRASDDDGNCTGDPMNYESHGRPSFWSGTGEGYQVGLIGGRGPERGGKFQKRDMGPEAGELTTDRAVMLEAILREFLYCTTSIGSFLPVVVCVAVFM